MENLFSSYSMFNQLLMSEIMLQLHDFSLTFFFTCFSFYIPLIMKTGISGQTNKKKKFNFKQFFFSFMKHNYTSKKKHKNREKDFSEMAKD